MSVVSGMPRRSTQLTRPYTVSSRAPTRHRLSPRWYGKISRARNRTHDCSSCRHPALTTHAPSFQGPQVRLVLNGATLPLSLCEASAEDKEYNTRSLDNFVRANAFSLSVDYHNAIWNATCEVPPTY